MTDVMDHRMAAQIEGDFVVLLIGMRSETAKNSKAPREEGELFRAQISLPLPSWRLGGSTL